MLKEAGGLGEKRGSLEMGISTHHTLQNVLASDVAEQNARQLFRLSMSQRNQAVLLAAFKYTHYCWTKKGVNNFPHWRKDMISLKKLS